MQVVTGEQDPQGFFPAAGPQPSAPAPPDAPEGSLALQLSLACSECDRTQALRDGSVQVEGVSLTCLGLPVEEVFHRMARFGEIDALYTPRTPAPFAQGRPEVRRLFPDAASEEARYFTRTGVFPIMHTAVLRRDRYTEHPWLARAFFKAFEQARRRALDGIDQTATLKYVVPWLPDEVARTRRLLGADYWPYGVRPNRHTLAAFLRYSFEQGLAQSLLSPDGLFARETLEDVIT